MSGGGSTPQTSWTVFPRLNNSEASNQAFRDRILWWMRVGWMAWYTWLQYYAWLAVCSVYSWPEISSYMNTMIFLETKHQTLPGLGVFSTKSGWLGGTVAATRSGPSLSSRWSLLSPVVWVSAASWGGHGPHEPIEKSRDWEPKQQGRLWFLPIFFGAGWRYGVGFSWIWMNTWKNPGFDSHWVTEKRGWKT